MVLKSPPIIRNAKSLSSSGGGDVQSVDVNGDVAFDQEAILPGCTVQCWVRLTPSSTAFYSEWLLVQNAEGMHEKARRVKCLQKRLVRLGLAHDVNAHC